MEAKAMFISGLLAASLAGCASVPEDTTASEYKLSQQCEQNLDTAYKELSFSEAKGFGGSWEYTKAASLLSAAKVQSGFGGYQGCIDKVNTARVYIRESQQNVE